MILFLLTFFKNLAQMFPPGGASTLKGFAAPAFGTTTTTTTAAAGGSDPLRNHHFRGSHGDEEGEGSGVDPGLPPALFADGPTPHPPLRPVRHVQHATQWAESKTTVAPGLIVRSTTASVNTTQWSEYSTTVTENRVFHGRSSSSTQFQTIRSNSGPSAAAPNSSVMTSAQYLDDLQVKNNNRRRRKKINESKKMLPMIENNAEEIVKIAKGMRDGRMNTAQHGTRNGNADGRAVLERDSVC